MRLSDEFFVTLTYYYSKCGFGINFLDVDLHEKLLTQYFVIRLSGLIQDTRYKILAMYNQ